MSESQIFDLYQALNIWKNPVCMACRNAAKKELWAPVGLWQLGRDFGNDPYKLLFIGKNARGEIHERAKDHLLKYGFIDGTKEADEWIKEDKRSSYFHYTAAIIEEIFGSLSAGWEKVAFTNLIKCNNSKDIDNTSLSTATNCLDNLQVAWKELEIIKPKNIIIYSHYAYDDFIDRYTSQFESIDITNKSFSVTVGKKKILWWERRCIDKMGDHSVF